MNKKVNTLIFTLVATIVIVGMIGIIFMAIMALVIVLFKNILTAEIFTIIGMVLFIASMFASFFLYSFLLKLFAKKVDMEKHFDPIFFKKRR